MRKLLWLIPAFFLVPTLVSILDVYAQFITGHGFLPASDNVFVLRVLMPLFSGFAGIISVAVLAAE